MIGELSRNGQVKDYICHYFSQEPRSVQLTRAGSEASGLKNIQVPENVGKMLQFFIRLKNPKRVLELGTLGGYSALWMAEALSPDATVITLEMDPAHVEISRNHIARAGFQERIEVRLGDAEPLMRAMVQQGETPFDLIFIDADKEGYPHYLELAIELSKSGTLILCDNMIPKRSEIGVPDPRDQEAVAIYACNQQLSSHPRLDATLFPTIVGEKGRIDAMGVAIVK